MSSTNCKDALPGVVLVIYRCSTIILDYIQIHGQCRPTSEQPPFRRLEIIKVCPVQLAIAIMFHDNFVTILAFSFHLLERFLANAGYSKPNLRRFTAHGAL